jgi:hypothetical protein
MAIDHKKALEIAIEETSETTERGRITETLKLDEEKVIKDFEESEGGQAMLEMWGAETFEEIVEDEEICTMFLHGLVFTEDGVCDERSVIWHLEDHEIKVLLPRIARKQPEALMMVLEDPHFPDTPKILAIFAESRQIAEAIVEQVS